MKRLAVTVTLAAVSLSATAFASGDPVALDKWGRHETTINARLVGNAGDAGSGWAPRIQVVIQVQNPQTDDLVLVQHTDGAGKPWGEAQKCKLEDDNLIKREGRDYHLVVTTCDAPESMKSSKTGTFGVKVGYRRTSEGKDFPALASYTYEVREAPYAIGAKVKKLWYVDHDFRIGEAWTYRTSEGELQVWSWFKYTDESLVTGAKMRCKNAGKTVDLFNGPRRQSVEVESYTAPGKQETTTWGLYYFFVAGDQARGLLAADGTWTCGLTQNGELARELSFQVASNEIKPAPCQSSAADGVRVVEDEQMIRSDQKKPQDVKFDAQAFRKAPLYGRKLAAGCPL